jgi:hypothetical protein
VTSIARALFATSGPVSLRTGRSRKTSRYGDLCKRNWRPSFRAGGCCSRLRTSTCSPNPIQYWWLMPSGRSSKPYATQAPGLHPRPVRRRHSGDTSVPRSSSQTSAASSLGTERRYVAGPCAHPISERPNSHRHHLSDVGYLPSHALRDAPARDKGTRVVSTGGDTRGKP